MKETEITSMFHAATFLLTIFEGRARLRFYKHTHTEDKLGIWMHMFACACYVL